MTREAILGVVMVPMNVCRERVDWYGMGFWGERVADPFLGPAIPTLLCTVGGSHFYLVNKC